MMPDVILQLPVGLSCPRCGSWTAVMDAELETIPRRSTAQIYVPANSGFLALLKHGNVGKLDAEWLTRPLWRCHTCAFAFCTAAQQAIADYIDEHTRRFEMAA